MNFRINAQHQIAGIRALWVFANCGAGLNVIIDRFMEGRF
jgi:hypothetical protein